MGEEVESRMPSSSTPGSRTVAVTVIVLLTLTWFASSIGISFFNRWMISHWGDDFRFPLALSAFGFSTNYLCSLIAVKLNPQALKGRRLCTCSVPIVLIGLLSAMDVALSNFSLSLVTVATYTVVKSSALVVNCIFSVLLKLKRLTIILGTSVFLVVLGVSLASLDDDGVSLKDTTGISIVLVASVLSALRWVVTQQVLHTGSRVAAPAAPGAHSYVTNPEDEEEEEEVKTSKGPGSSPRTSPRTSPRGGSARSSPNHHSRTQKLPPPTVFIMMAQTGPYS